MKLKYVESILLRKKYPPAKLPNLRVSQLKGLRAAAQWMVRVEQITAGGLVFNWLRACLTRTDLKQFNNKGWL